MCGYGHLYNILIGIWWCVSGIVAATFSLYGRLYNNISFHGIWKNKSCVTFDIKESWYQRIINWCTFFVWNSTSKHPKVKTTYGVSSGTSKSDVWPNLVIVMLYATSGHVWPHHTTVGKYRDLFTVMNIFIGIEITLVKYDMRIAVLVRWHLYINTIEIMNQSRIFGSDSLIPLKTAIEFNHKQFSLLLKLNHYITPNTD